LVDRHRLDVRLPAQPEGADRGLGHDGDLQRGGRAGQETRDDKRLARAAGALVEDASSVANRLERLGTYIDRRDVKIIEIESFVEDEVRPVARRARFAEPARPHRPLQLEPRVTSVVHRAHRDERRTVAQGEHDRDEAAQVCAELDVDANH
jgi:hypothetical protein